MCLSGRCPIEDLATDPTVNEFIEEYLLAKNLYLQTEDPKVQEQTFKELGLYENKQLHFRLETIWNRWRIAKMEEQRQAKA